MLFFQKEKNLFERFFFNNIFATVKNGSEQQFIFEDVSIRSKNWSFKN